MELDLKTAFALLALLPAGYCTSVQPCPQACKELQAALPTGQVSIVPKPNAYWAAQIQTIKAACYVYPATTQDISKVVKTVSKYQCQFAIRGGGHSGVPSSNNLAGGLVLNLDAFNNVQLSSDKTYALVGAGTTWGKVYESLDPLGYAAIGGRDPGVGVSGLTLGGGISFFSGQYGFACDNVVAYEFVLADGYIKTITQQSDPDLFRALRGGGNNFAIATQFHLAVYKYDLFQSGLDWYTNSDTVQKDLLSTTMHFMQHGQDSPDAYMYLGMGIFPNGTSLWATELSYTKPSPPVSDVSAFQLFYTPEVNVSRISSSHRIGSLTSFATELTISAPTNERMQYYTGTYIADEQLLNEICNGFRDTAMNMQAQLKAKGSTEFFTPIIFIEPFTTNMLKLQSRSGGNVLGLDTNGPPLMILAMSWAWTNLEDDAFFRAGMNDVIQTSNKLAKKRGLTSDFVYMNYAQTDVPVMRGYGEENVAFMKAVSARYDPEGVFQKLVSGGFKLP